MNNKVNFLVLGAQKSGTSALDKYLRDHHEIEMANIKEVHFFDNEENFNASVNYEKYHQFFTSKDNKIRGECTPIYMYWHSSIRRIYEYNPQIKIIAILRNPIERAFSHWNMERDRNADTLDFSTAIKHENERCREALPLQHRVYSYIDRGFYSEQIRRIWRYFPKEQTLFIKHEDLKGNPHEVLNQISHFLKLSEFKNVEERDVHSRPYVNALTDNDHKYLSDLFINEINQIELMLDWDCSNWKYKRTDKLLHWIKKNLTFFNH